MKMNEEMINWRESEMHVTKVIKWCEYVIRVINYLCNVTGDR
jgi:hypothetical protein